MKAQLLISQRYQLSEDEFVELVVWQVPEPVRGSCHAYKYRLAFMQDGVCVVRFDNEAGKGDHFHAGTVERNYVFDDVETLHVDFWTEVDEWRKRKGY